MKTERTFHALPVAAALAFALVHAGALRLCVAQDQYAAAVVPASGSVSPAELKNATIEVRNQLRDYGYTLALQSHVRAALAPLGANRPLNEDQLATLSRNLSAQLVVAPSIGLRSDGRLQLEIVAYTPAWNALKGYAAVLGPPGSSGYDRDQLRPAVIACVAAVISTPIAPGAGGVPAVFPLDLSGLAAQPAKVAPIPSPAPSGRIVQDLPPAQDQPPAPTQDPPPPLRSGKDDLYLITGNEEESHWWDEFDHTKVFIDLGFVAAWCFGDALCEDGSSGFGGRLRVGYRIVSVWALSVTGALAGHDVPLSTDKKDYLSVDQALIWTGAHLGLRIHPINRFFIDPFVGIDVGWSWMFYSRTDEIDLDEISGVDPDLIPDDLKDLAKRHSVVSLNGFSLAPQIGVNLFITRNVALGAVFEWLKPFWNEVCMEYELTPLSTADSTGGQTSGDQCVPIDDAADLQDDTDYLERLPEQPPWLISVQANLVFLI